MVKFPEPVKNLSYQPFESKDFLLTEGVLIFHHDTVVGLVYDDPAAHEGLSAHDIVNVLEFFGATRRARGTLHPTPEELQEYNKFMIND